MSRRAEALSKRIEEGAERLARFVRDLSESEWQMPVSATDRRSIGTVVHHVASVYPVETQLAQAVASGKTIADVTPEVVDRMNAAHAKEHAAVPRTVTLELLRQNSCEAVRAVRELTDEELDRALPFSLTFGAPVTAQFIIEDHALRHSWHHLDQIRKAVGR